MFRNFRRIFLACLICLPVLALASHGEGDNITSIDGFGNGFHVGTFVHVDGTGANHPWIAFCAIAGSTVTVSMASASFDNYLWIYDVLDDNAQVGDANGVDYTLVADGGGSINTTLNFVAGSSGQFIVQADSFLGGSGSYLVIISGAASNSCAVQPAIPVPTINSWALFLLLGLILMVAAFSLRRKSSLH